MRISTKRKTTAAEGETECLPEVTNSIAVFAAKERDQPEMESTVETKEQRQVGREQACVNLEDKMLSEGRID